TWGSPVGEGATRTRTGERAMNLSGANCHLGAWRWILIFILSLRKRKNTEDFRLISGPWFSWRRGGDSNPRHRFCQCNCLAGSPVRPLQHLSAAEATFPARPDLAGEEIVANSRTGWPDISIAN